MRILVFFDLPVGTSMERRDYRRFRQHLIKNGFVMMQQSVYSKIALNATVVHAIVADLRKEKPEAGNVQVLSVTEKQYARIEFILGQSQSTVIDSDERLVIL